MSQEEITKFQNQDQRKIKRSAINFAPYNPRDITESALKELKKNIRKRSLLGGIVINENTMNIVSGHRRVEVLDELMKYNGKKGTDYNLIAEFTKLTEKEEKEQNIFMNSTTVQGTFDYEKLAAILPDIDYKAAGLDDYDISLIAAEAPQMEQGNYSEVKSDLTDMDKPYEKRKADIKKAKEDQKNKVNEQFDGDPFFSVAFDNFENKAEFMGMFGLDPDDKFVKGEVLLENIMNKEA